VGWFEYVLRTLALGMANTIEWPVRGADAALCPITLTTRYYAGMRILVMLLLDTLPMLGNVLLLCFFVFFIFGIIGVQLWAGLLRNRCFLDLPDNVSAAW